MILLWTLTALEKYGCVGAEFIDDLAARTARRTSNVLVVHDGDGADLDFGTELRDGRKNRRTLGAVRHSVRGVFHIATGKDLAVRQQNGGADPKF